MKKELTSYDDSCDQIWTIKNTSIRNRERISKFPSFVDASRSFSIDVRRETLRPRESFAKFIELEVGGQKVSLNR